MEKAGDGLMDGFCVVVGMAIMGMDWIWRFYLPFFTLYLLLFFTLFFLSIHFPASLFSLLPPITILGSPRSTTYSHPSSPIICTANYFLFFIYHIGFYQQKRERDRKKKKLKKETPPGTGYSIQTSQPPLPQPPPQPSSQPPKPPP